MRSNLVKKLTFISINKNLFIQLALVSVIFSLPIYYLIYFNYHSYEDSHLFTTFEQSGVSEVKLILNEFGNLVIHTPPKISDDFKGIFFNSKRVINEFNLSEIQLKEFQNINLNQSMLSKEDISDKYMAPLLRFVGNSSKLILDPEIDSYYLMDVLVLKSPKIYQILLRDSEFVSIERLLKQIQIITGEIRYSLNQVLAEHQEKRQDLQNLNLCYQYLDKEIDKQLSDNKFFNIVNISKTLNQCNNFNANVLAQILKIRSDLLQRKYLVTLSLTLLLWIIGTVSGFYIYLKVIEKEVDSSLTIVNQEKKILESEKLTTLGELASSIVHEIKNPLTLINYEAGALYKIVDNSEPKNEFILGKLTKISQMTKRITKISNMITIYTRDSQNDEFEEVNSQNIIEDSLYIINLKAKSFDITLNVNTEAIFCRCRPYQIEQVIINLLNNSIDEITPLKEKWINISSELVDIQDKQWLRINIIDSGPGISKDIQDKIFNNFYTTKIAGKGTGLGLAVSLKIAEGHSGRLYYDNTTKNTKFVLEIPVNIDG